MVIALIVILIPIVTWLFYLAIMNMQGKYKTMGKTAKAIGYKIAFVGILIDVFFNFVYGTVIFLDPPRELLFTARLKRYKYGEYASWRKKLAAFICEEFLDPYDPSGCHCDK